MVWEMESDKYIFLQISEKIMFDIIRGVYCPGDKLPSVRQLAKEAAVNQNTMQKALSELEHMGLVYSQRTKGRFVTEDSAVILQQKEKMIETILENFLEKMNKLGYQNKEDIVILVEEI